MGDRYDEQLSAARYRAERDQARQELARLRGEATTMSAYDLLPEEDREALRWVRKQGGLNDVKSLHDNGELPLRDLCEILGLDRVNTSWMDAFRELEKRLMPSGMEWPTVDGKPVDFVTGYAPSLGVLEAVSIYSNGACEVMSHDGIINSVTEIHISAPEVPAADGKPLREGETVWSVDSGTRYTVEKITDGLIPIKCRSEMGSTVSLHPSQLTHERHVLAGGGKPLLKHETVYEIKTGERYFVTNVFDGMTEPDFPEHTVECRKYEDVVTHMFRPGQLTHQRPVLDAEGNRIEPAMDVWWICEGDERGVHAEKLHVESIGEDGLVTCDPFNSGTWVELEPSELYVNRPVLDAKGVPVREGETVYANGNARGNGSAWRVLRIDPGISHPLCCEREDGEPGGARDLKPEWVTHRAPALAADGKPLEVGQTVYHIADGKEYRVSELLKDGGAMVESQGRPTGRCRADYLTHERHDSWERIEEDARLKPSEYADRYRIGRIGFEAEDMRVDLVRRCRALAERGE